QLRQGGVYGLHVVGLFSKGRVKRSGPGSNRPMPTRAELPRAERAKASELPADRPTPQGDHIAGDSARQPIEVSHAHERASISSRSSAPPQSRQTWSPSSSRPQPAGSV